MRSRVVAALLSVLSLSVLAGLATTAPAPGFAAANTPGWLGSRSANVAQNVVASIDIPPSFATADLLVAVVATDGPDTFPVGSVTTETTAVFGGTSSLRWTRDAHVSARRDVVAPGDQRELFGASVAEVWTAIPAGGRTVAGTITVTTNHPNTHDDGMAVAIAAFSHATLARVVTFDGLKTTPERAAVAVPADSAIYAATFAGRRNADFLPLPGLHVVAERRAGDDTAGVIASNSRDLPSGMQSVGYSGPRPGDYWEVAAAVITAQPPGG